MRISVIGATLSLAVAATVGLGSGAGLAQTSSQFGTGLIPSTPEQYSRFKKVKRYRSFFGPRIDLSDRFPKAGAQGMHGTCTAWAVGYAARSFLSAAEQGRPLQTAEYISPAYVYNKAKQHSGCAQGLPMQAALELLKNEGASTLSRFPYDASWCEQSPPVSASAEAPQYRIFDWEAIDRGAVGKTAYEDWREPVVLDDIKGQLWKGYPVVFGMKLPPDFFNLRKFAGTYKSNAQVDRANITSRDMLHAMALVGYDNDRQAFRLINSWGEIWGDNGYLWIDYDTFARLVTEAYVIRPVKAVAPAPAPPVPPANIPTEVRLKQALGTPECGRVNVEMRDGKYRVSGFGGSPANLADLRKRAQAIAPNLQWDVQLRPWPQCETELIIASAAPDAGAEIRIAKEGGAQFAGDTVSLKADDLFTIEAETTADRPYIHVVYIQADGSAVELYRGAPTPDAEGRRRQMLGASGKRDVRFQVAPPFGHELIVSVASNKPLFDAGLANYTTEREFLSALQTALVRAHGSGTPVSASIRRLQTSGS